MHIRPTIRRGLFFPPGATPRINEAHPAAGQLVGAYLGGGRPLALRPGYGNLSVKTGAPVPAMGRAGWYTSYTATSGHVATTSPSGDTSVVAVAMRSITPGSAGTVSNIPVIATTVNIVATRAGFIFSLGNGYSGTPNRISAEQYVGGVQSSPSAAWVNGTRETLTSGIGTTDLANGVWYGIGTTYTGLAAGNGALTLGTMVDNYFALTGGVQFLAIFQGLLPDGLMSELTLNPAGLLLWPEDDLGRFVFRTVPTTHALTATSIVTGAPVVGTPAVGQVHALSATSIATGAPVVGSPTVGQTHVLSAADVVTGAPVVGSPVLNASASVQRTVRLPARDRSHVLAARDRAVRLPVRDRTITLGPERT